MNTCILQVAYKNQSLQGSDVNSPTSDDRLYVFLIQCSKLSVSRIGNICRLHLPQNVLIAQDDSFADDVLSVERYILKNLFAHVEDESVVASAISNEYGLA